MKASFSKINITPDLPVRLSGFGVKRIAHEILDPVYARIHYFKPCDGWAREQVMVCMYVPLKSFISFSFL